MPVSDTIDLSEKKTNWLHICIFADNSWKKVTIFLRKTHEIKRQHKESNQLLDAIKLNTDH